MLVDSHCHPDDAAFAGDRSDVLARAAAAGVTELVAIGGGAAPGTLGVGLEVRRAALSSASAAGSDRPAGGVPRVWATVGIHPHEAENAREESFAEMRALAAEPGVIAIGEIGLDYHYDHSPREAQRRVFARQLALAAELSLPVSIHTREAWAETAAEIRAARLAAGGVFHCFAGGRGEAEEAMALGFYLSFSGMLTFRSADAIREAAAWAPAERLLIETDSPYLAPAPHRGKRNEPAWVAEVARALGELRGWSAAEAGRVTGENFHRLFPRAGSDA